MTAAAPIQTFLPTVIGAPYSSICSRSRGSSGCVAAQSWTAGPTSVPAPTRTGVTSSTTQLKFMKTRSSSSMFQP